MQIEESLELTKQNNNKVCFINDSGLFCKLYNQSVYIITTQLNKPLNFYIKTFKKLNNEPVIISGYPMQSVLKHFSTAEQTPWGFELSGDFDLSGYDAFVNQAIAKHFALQSHQAAVPLKQSTQFTTTIQPPQKLEDDSQLTAQQLAFLATWQKDKYSANDNSDFIQELKTHLGF